MRTNLIILPVLLTWLAFTAGLHVAGLSEVTVFVQPAEPLRGGYETGIQIGSSIPCPDRYWQYPDPQTHCFGIVVTLWRQP